MLDRATIEREFQENGGVLRLIPNFVPRRFGQPGHRLRLHPDDYFALGMHRGAIKERWFSSVTPAMNGPDAPADEGMSYVALESGRALLRDVVEALGERLIGAELMARHGTWPIFSKYFDYQDPLFFHLHLSQRDAERVGRNGKPEAYYFPPQLNNHMGIAPYTYFGLAPGVTREQVRERLARMEAGDNRVTELSTAHRIALGTGWYTPAGVLHAPASVLTYEVQWNSDVNSVYENLVNGQVYDHQFLVENCPEDKKQDLDYVIGLLDWEANTTPDYKSRYFRPPVLDREGDGYRQNWVVYGCEGYFFAKELTVLPGCTATIHDAGAYGCVVTQGFGRLGSHAVEAPTLLRYGQESRDEFFVGAQAAAEGIVVSNNSECEPLVLLKHFGPADAVVGGIR